MVGIKIKAVIVAALVMSGAVSAQEKYCSVSGMYYCAYGEKSPEKSPVCSRNPASAVIERANYMPGFLALPGWAAEPWQFSRSTAPSGKQRVSGVSQILIYTQAWRNASHPSQPRYDTAQVLAYNCKLCPPGTVLNGSGCLAEPAKNPVNNGSSCDNSTGHPVNISTGNKYYHEIDYGDADFTVSRAYNSSTGRWVFNYRQNLHMHSLEGQPVQAGGGGASYYPHEIWSTRPDGKVVRFVYEGARGYVSRSPVAKVSLRLDDPAYNALLVSNKGDVYVRDSSGLLLIENNKIVIPDFIDLTHEFVMDQTRERYDVHGRLRQLQVSGQSAQELSYSDHTVTVTKNDRQITVISDPANYVVQIALPDNSMLDYVYDSAPQERVLIRVSRTSQGVSKILRQYFYEDSRHPALITGVENEAGARISSVRYDDQGRAISSQFGPEHAGIERSLIRYNNNNTRTVTNALGKEATYHFTQYLGEYKITRIDGHPSSNCAGANRIFNYDLAGRLLSSRDWKGVLTTYDYDNRGLEISRIVGYGTPQARSVITEWHPELFLPLVVTEPARRTIYQYDDQGRQLSRIIRPR